MDSAFREYKDKVIETLGADKEEKITQDIAEDRIKAATPAAQAIILGTNDVLCYDMLTGRLFKSDVETIRRAVNDLDAQVLTDQYASLNEFYILVGLDTVMVGEEMGFNIDHRPELQLGSYLNDCGQPCLAISFKSMPIREYDKF